MTQELIEKITTVADKLLGLMAVEAKVEVIEEEGGYTLNIEAGEANGLLIGRRGETLSSLQFIISISLREELGEDTRVFVNVGDWKEKQEDYLNGIATEAAKKVRETKEPYPLYNLNASQRRIVHMQLANETDLVTESTGEGEERYLIVKLKE